ncbi:hypothetical protein ACQ858_22265 [Variovorax ureilyticus]|uniref:hypothetical protein n=1 Tax=Variovorax ureilyticus TaxID=1836198 RepID=UPI003D66D65B
MTAEEQPTHPPDPNPWPSKPLRLQAAFSEVQDRLDDIAAIVTAHNAELVLTRTDGSALAVIDARQWDRYQALEAELSRARQASESTARRNDDETGWETDPSPSPLLVAADYCATNSDVSPRTTLERFRLEVELPGDAGEHDVSIRVGDDQSVETFLATWKGFSWGQMSLAEAVLRCFFHARYGSPKLPTFGEYPEAFDQVLLSINHRSNSEPLTSHCMLSASRKSGEWTLNGRTARTGMNSPAWHCALPDAPHPLLVMWLASGSIDGRDIRESQQRSSRSPRTHERRD